MPATSQSLKKLSKIIKKYQRQMEVFRRLDFFSKPIMKTFVIGIGGVTNGGKTTLAKNLQKHLPNCSVISQDDFFKPESEIGTDENGFLQYDVLEALNMEKMMSAISCWVENPRLSVEPALLGRLEKVPILIIEGFLLFNYKPLDTIWNRSYFLTIPYEECKRRRSTRVYEPPDPPGYFDGHVWPMYLKHRQEMNNISQEIVYLDGTKSEEDLFAQVYEDITQELERQNGKYCSIKGDGRGEKVWKQFITHQRMACPRPKKLQL